MLKDKTYQSKGNNIKSPLKYVRICKIEQAANKAMFFLTATSQAMRITAIMNFYNIPMFPNFIIKFILFYLGAF